MPHPDDNVRRSSLYTAGLHAGRRWARGAQQARRGGQQAAAIGRLARLRTRLEQAETGGWTRFLTREGATKCALAEALFFEMFPDHSGDQTAAERFWDGIVADCATHNDAAAQLVDPSPGYAIADLPGAFLLGFAEGVLAAGPG